MNKKIVKKFGVVLLSGVMLFSLTACGGSDTPEEDPVPVEEEIEETDALEEDTTEEDATEEDAEEEDKKDE